MRRKQVPKVGDSQSTRTYYYIYIIHIIHKSKILNEKQ
jgi:hypothetical protein